MKFYTIICFILLGMVSVKGRDYAIGFLNLGSSLQGDIMQSNLLMTAAGKAVVNVSMEILNQTVNIKENVYFRFVMNPLWERAKSTEKVEDTAIFMTSEHDYCVHAVSLDFESFGGFHPQPVTEKSKEFYIPSYLTTGWRSSAFLIVASEADTNVNYTVRDRNTGEFGPLQNITGLNKHEKFQVKSKSADFTGSYVTSDKPIALFAGVDCGHVPYKGVKYDHKCDHMSVGVPPVSDLGKRYIVAPLVGRAKDMGYVVRVISTKADTTVDISQPSSLNSTVLARGGFWEINLNSSLTLDIKCSEPCLVVQYCKSKIDQDDKWDNFMLMVPSIENYENKLIWANPVDRHGLGMICYSNIVVPYGKQNGVRVDDKVVPNSAWKTNPGGDYMVASVRQSYGAHRAHHTDDSTKIGVTVYGRGTKEAHAFGYIACPAGSKFGQDDGEEDEEDVYTDDGGEEPEVAPVCDAPEDDNLLPLWYILCLLMGLVIGVVLGVLLVWLRVRKLKGVTGYIFNPFSSYSDDMDQDLVEAHGTSKGAEYDQPGVTAVQNVLYGVTDVTAEPNIYSEIHDRPIRDEKGVSFS